MRRLLFKRSRRNLLTSLLLVTLACRALTPTGFMPSGHGPFSMTICHAGMPAPIDTFHAPEWIVALRSLPVRHRTRSRTDLEHHSLSSPRSSALRASTANSCPCEPSIGSIALTRREHRPRSSEPREPYCGACIGPAGQALARLGMTCCSCERTWGNGNVRSRSAPAWPSDSDGAVL